jgi:hypothetical protein
LNLFVFVFGCIRIEDGQYNGVVGTLLGKIVFCGKKMNCYD